MKVFLKQSLVVLLSLLILVSSTGVVIAAHTCLYESKTDVSLFEAKGCCGKQKKKCSDPVSRQSNYQSRCCLLKISLHKLNTVTPFSTGAKITLDQPVFVLPGSALTEPKAAPSSYFFSKAPPHYRGGPSFLHLSCTLII